MAKNFATYNVRITFITDKDNPTAPDDFDAEFRDSGSSEQLVRQSAVNTARIVVAGKEWLKSYKIEITKIEDVIVNGELVK
jgi:hypothetical protein